MTVNKQAVALPYKKFGLSIYESGINRVVEIPELKMNVTYNGLSFSIRMPHSLFGNNTHGQCGKAYSCIFCTLRKPLTGKRQPCHKDEWNLIANCE